MVSRRILAPVAAYTKSLMSMASWRSAGLGRLLGSFM
jgi:hypothetical protein